MENATKALLMAGAVLIAIILIAVAVRTINSTKGTTESVQTTMSATEMATFNNKFAGYTGTGVPYARVKALANLVIASNASSKHQVSFMTKTTPTAIDTAVNGLDSKKNCTVGVTRDNNENSPTYGIITGITVSQ